MNSAYEIKVTARGVGSDEYTVLENCGLTACFDADCMGKQVITVKNTGDKAFKGVVQLEMVFDSKEPKFFMPAYMYNRNRGNVKPYLNKDGQYLPFPRMAIGSDMKGVSDFWMVRGDRLSHPVSIAVNGGTAYGVSVNPVSEQKCAFNGFTSHLGEDKSSVGITLGYENAPILYVIDEAKLPDEALEDTGVTIGAGEEISAEIQLFCKEVSDERGINEIIRTVYEQYHEAPRKASSVKQTVEDIATAIYEDAYVESSKTYSTRVTLKNGEVRQEPLASISWTGGVEVAAPMLYCAARLKDEKMREQALTVIEKIVKGSLNPKSGLPFDAYDDNRWYTEGWWDDFFIESGHSSYLVGQALYYILNAYRIDKEFFGVEHADWLDWVRGCLDKIETTKDENGEVPHVWSAEDGRALDYDSFSGAWCVAAAVYYDKLCGTSLYTESAEKSATHYYEDIKRMECYGTPHDTQKAVDSEGSLAFMKAVRILHELTGKDEYIKMLSDALEYEFTFKFCWNPKIQVEPLKRIGWSCCGGSVTSTCNAHIHPMSNNVSDEIAYCYKATGDEYFKQRLDDTTGWALQTYSTFDGEYDYGKKGWMSERFCYSQGLLIEKYDNGELCSTWKCFLPWGASNILEGLCGVVWDEAEK